MWPIAYEWVVHLRFRSGLRDEIERNFDVVESCDVCPCLAPRISRILEGHSSNNFMLHILRHFLFGFFIVLGWEVVVFLTGELPKQGYKSSEECEDVDYKMGSHPNKL